ncbi:MAG TPA: hypothetical protein VGI39_45745 [Polyangiaceae bacterium]|jgi:hypothetical protein
MRPLLIAGGILSFLLCAATALAEPPRSSSTPSQAMPSHQAYGHAPRPTSPGNPNSLTLPSARASGSFGTSSVSGWGGPNPAYQRR